MRIGQVIAGRFRVRSLIGSGGMGRVYRAMDETTEQSVALKVLSLDAKKYSRRFLREAKVMAELGHPNIVRYVDYGQTDRGAPYIVMEWVRGEDLRQRMNRKKVELEEALEVIAGTGEALAFAHSRGVIHRDLKPSNLMLVGGDIKQIKLLDFGIARWRGPAVEKMTQTGISIGTPGYMAPEQSRGDSVIDGRADLYALGCVIYECLIGKRPFQGEDVTKMLARNAFDEPPRVSEKRGDISTAFDDLLADMMAANVERRPADGSIMAARARAIDAGASTSTLVDPPEAGLSNAEKELISVILIETRPGNDEDPVLADVAHRKGGRVRKLDDGSTLILCQDPKSSASNLALRAVRCALQLRQLQPDAKLAIATGLGESAYLTAKSALMIRASQLRHSAEAATIPPSSKRLSIRLDETTYRLLDGRFDVRRRRDDPTPGFDLLGAVVHVHTTQVPRGASPCIGREQELQLLCGLMDQSVKDARARAMLIVGEAGIGKSRLCGELCLQLRAKHEGIKVWSARAEPLGQKQAFGILGQLLRQACEISRSDGLSERRHKIFKRVQSYLPEEEAEQVAEFLGELCKTPFPADSSRRQLHAARGNAVLMGERMRNAWEGFLKAASAAHPVLLVIEDAHGTDLSTLRLFESTLKTTGGSWMFVMLARPEIETIFSDNWQAQGFERLALQGLTEDASEDMIHSLLGHAATRGTIDRLVRLSSGNPLFLQELLRSVKSKQRADISSTVLALTMVKLQPLNPEERRVLRAASIFGPSFTAKAVHKVLGHALEMSALDAMLRRLVEAQYLLRSEGSRRGDAQARERWFLFSDELVRQAAYNTLTPADQAQGHRVVGEWLHESGVRDGDILARHFELGRDAGQAALWYHHAARLALTENNLADAMRRAQKGIDTNHRGEALGHLHATMAAALLWTGDNAKASEHSMWALDSIPESQPEWAEAAGDAVTALGRCGASVDVQSISQRLLADRPPGGYVGSTIAALARSATQLLEAEHYDEACTILDALPPEANILADSAPSAHGHLLSALASRSLYQGDLSSLLRMSHSSAAHFQSCGDKRSAVLAQISVGGAYAQLGDYASAESVFKGALASAGELDLGSMDSLARMGLGRVMLALGNYSEAWDLELVAIESFQMQGNDRLANASRVCLSQVHQRQASLDSAETQAREALHGTNTAATVRMLAHAQLASVLLDLARPKEALDSAQQAGSILGSIGQVGDGESFVRLVLVQAHQQCGSAEKARAALSAAHASLQGRFARIEDPSLRLSFIEQVAENARIVELAAEWGVSEQ